MNPVIASALLALGACLALESLADAIGVTVLDVDLQGVEVRSGPELLRLLR
ncbi:hypothetical protein [Nocardioides caldifontis]|uniref:hypothetical protein n=1 Tax=Nocardioides caldifontis TaxID=2588938 RepID=UPI001396A0D5|nr:hypothetical protein [Nocardioides caldifontis]